MIKTVALGDVATIERTVRSPERIESGTLYVGLENIERGGELLDVRRVETGELGSAKFDFTNRHILYGKLRPYLAKIAVPSFAGVCSTDIVPILPGDAIDRSYLCRFLRQPSVVELATSRAVGANLPRLNPSELARFPVPLPPLEEQRRIAAVLNQVDDLRAKRRASLALAESLNELIFLDMFGDPAVNEPGWPLEELANVVAAETIVTYGIVQAGKEFPGGVPYIRTGDIVGGRVVIDLLRRTDPAIAARFGRSRVKVGDIVMSIRATVGTTAMVEPGIDGANLTQGTARIASGSRMDPWYLLSFLRSDFAQRWIQRQVKGATFQEITLKRLRELPVLLPPIELQRDFAGRVAEVRRTINLASSGTMEVDALFASLQHRAFSGHL